MSRIESQGNIPDPNFKVPHRSLEEILSIFKKGLKANYYHIDTEEERQPLMVVPFINKRCKDCPFFIKNPAINNYCRVWNRSREEEATTCAYFDETNHESAEAIIQDILWQAYKKGFLNKKSDDDPGLTGIK